MARLAAVLVATLGINSSTAAPGALVASSAEASSLSAVLARMEDMGRQMEALQTKFAKLQQHKVEASKTSSPPVSEEDQIKLERQEIAEPEAAAARMKNSDTDGIAWVQREHDGVYVAANDTTYLWEDHVEKHKDDEGMVGALRSGPPTGVRQATSAAP